MDIYKAVVGEITIRLGVDNRKKDDGGRGKLSVIFTEKKRREYFPLGGRVSQDEFEKILSTDIDSLQRGKMSKEKEIHLAWRKQFNGIVERVRDLSTHTQVSLDKITNMLTGRSKESNFIDVWENVIKAKKASTADSYKTALSSFMKCLGLIGNDEKINELAFKVDEDVIHGWVQKLTDEGKTKATIGIYLRSCRVVVNECIKQGYIEKGNYPFGKDGDKVSIPRPKNRKHEFLNVEQMSQLYRIFTNKDYPKHWTEERRKAINGSLGLFLFMYLGNGMNLADVARLEYNNYYKDNKGEAIRFERTKTKDRTDDNSEVIVPVIPQLKAILEELAAPCEMGERMFPHLLGDAKTDEQILRRVQQENQNIRKHLRKLTEHLGWTETVSPTWCRHSFATNLLHAGGVPKEYISEAMGHSERGSVTMGYVGKFSLEDAMRFNAKLLDIQDESNKDEEANKGKVAEFLAQLSQSELEQLRLMLNKT